MKRYFRFVAAFIALAVLMVPAAVVAQQTESRITGRVVDDTKAAMPGATVTVTSRQTGAVRTVVTGGDGSYTVTNLGPGTYTVLLSLPGSRPRRASSCSASASSKRSMSRLASRGCRKRSPCRRFARHRHLIGENRRQRVAGRSRQSSRQRPQLRQPDDPCHRRDERRQRRMGERSLQRQVESAELPELRRCGRHLRVGRQPGLPQFHRFAIPAADVDGVGRGVSRELGPRARRERPGRRRQHHGRQQERDERVSGSLFEYKRDDALDSASKYDDKKQELELDQFGGSIGGPIASNRTFFFASFEGLRQTTGLSFTEAVPSDEARRRIIAGEPVGSARARAQPAPRPWRRFWTVFPQSDDATSNPLLALATLNTTAEQKENSLSLRVDHRLTASHSFYVRYLFSDGDFEYAGSHGDAAPRPRQAAAAERGLQPSVARGSSTSSTSSRSVTTSRRRARWRSATFPGTTRLASLSRAR